MNLYDFSHATQQLVDAIRGVAPREPGRFYPGPADSALACAPLADSYASRVEPFDVRPEITCPRCLEICANARASERRAA